MARRRPDLRLLVPSLVIALGMVLVAAGFLTSTTGSEAQGLPDEIESIEPVKNAVRVPAQTRVFVDLLPGYEGVLVIDGIEIPTTNLNAPSVTDFGDTVAAIPGQQVSLPPNTIFEPGNATLTFVPNEDALVDKFEQGLHSVTVIFWRTTEGRSRAQTFTWDFNVF